MKRGARLVISVHVLYAQSVRTLAEKHDLSNIRKALGILHRKKNTTVTKEGGTNVYTWTPDEFRAMLERNGVVIEKILAKGVTMPLRISKNLFMQKESPEDLHDSILRLELALCEKQDVMALASILQAIARKPP